MIYQGAEKDIALIWQNFLVKIGVQQGLLLSSLPFITVIDATTGDIQKAPSEKLLYADDIFLKGSTREQLEDEARN